MKAKPQFLEPMKARLVGELPTGPEWLYELKLDGYRCMALKRDRVRIISSRGNDLTQTFPHVTAAVQTLGEVPS